MEKAYNFAKRHRALGVGTLGWHHLLQSRMLPFESDEAMRLNKEVHAFINDKAWKASRELAEIFGEPEILEGYGRRNTTLTAIAPTKSSSYILEQTSQSIEPELSNYFIKDLSKVKVTVMNKYLKEVLKGYDKDNDEVWSSIRKKDGSVQHLDFLTENEKAVFKTFGEIDPFKIIEQAADRQPHVDQSQSINLMISSKMATREINQLYLYAWEMGLKSLYYQKSTNAAQDAARDRACAACEA
jgi:ribonucleoside-diphosphate reductase alpha chain